MTYKVSHAVILVLVAAGVAYSQFPARCHTTILTPHHFLNLNKFLGVWHPLKVAPSKAHQIRPLNYTCLSVNYTQTGVNNVLGVTETYLELENGTVTRPGRADSVAVIGEINPAQPIPAIQSLYYTPPGSNETVNSHLVVLSSDEESWAVVYSCSDRDGELLERISLWSRERTLNPVVLDVLDKVAYGIGFPYSHFENVVQTNCTA